MKTKNSIFWLSLGIIITVTGAIITALLPPLFLGRIIDQLSLGSAISLRLLLLYFLFIAITGILESSRESLLIILGQKITHALRSRLIDKLTQLPADTLSKQDPGAVVSRFVGDVNTVETLFTSGIISMIADACKIISILVIIGLKNKGLALILLLLLPIIYAFTRWVQKRMLVAEVDNRVAVSRVTSHVPESIRCIRTIHSLGQEAYMEERYDDYIGRSYDAIEKTNFYDAIYSPVILILNAIIVAVVMLLSASGNPHILEFFGMSVGTAVAIINYISQIFAPIESLGMEIQTIQSAIAGVKRIKEFLNQTERTLDTSPKIPPIHRIELSDVTFGYDKTNPILKNLSFSIDDGEQITFVGRTGAGKSTLFKLFLGLYQPQSGEIRIDGMTASSISDSQKRQIFGYVEQTFHQVPGSIKDQITLSDCRITTEMAIAAAKLVGLHETICNLEHGYDTICTPAIFSQGQWQLLSIARAVAGNPSILLLDEITANLDADTEQTVLQALQNVSTNRTVLSISHRIYEHTGGRIISL